MTPITKQQVEELIDRLASKELTGKGSNPKSRKNLDQTSHGMHGTPTYKTWTGIKRRCLNEKDAGFQRYGAKGIKVCEKWLKFEGFLEDMGERPDGMTIDRINPRGDYEKSNCRWATPFQQGSENKTNFHLLTFNGKTQSVAMWSRETGLSLTVIVARINKYGWTVERALSTPVVKQCKGYIYDKARQKYRVHVEWKGKQHFVGRYDSVEEALEARIKFITKLRNEM